MVGGAVRCPATVTRSGWNRYQDTDRGATGASSSFYISPFSEQVFWGKASIVRDVFLLLGHLRNQRCKKHFASDVKSRCEHMNNSEVHYENLEPKKTGQNCTISLESQAVVTSITSNTSPSSAIFFDSSMPDPWLHLSRICFGSWRDAIDIYGLFLVKAIGDDTARLNYETQPALFRSDAICLFAFHSRACSIVSTKL
jgi:hypothetical protein